MKLALFGATGATGRHLVEQALVAGHTVTALVRNPAGVTTQHPSLTVVPGNVLTPADVTKTVQDADAVIVSLGNTANNPDLSVSNGTRIIVEAMQGTGVRRLIVISSLGVGDSKDQVPFYFKIVAKTILRKAMQDKEGQEQIVRASGLDWTIVRPGGLSDEARSGQYQSGTDPSIVAGRVARADVAEFVLKQLTDRTFVGKSPAIT